MDQGFTHDDLTMWMASEHVDDRGWDDVPTTWTRPENAELADHELPF